MHIWEEEENHRGKSKRLSVNSHEGRGFSKETQNGEEKGFRTNRNIREDRALSVENKEGT